MKYRRPLANGSVARKQPPWLVVVVCIAIFAAGGLVSYFFVVSPANGKSANSSGRAVRLGASGLINPLLFTQDTVNPASQLDPLKNLLAAKVKDEENAGSASDVGVYVRDLNAGVWTGVSADRQFSPASLLKVPVMMAYLKLRESNPSIANDKLLYDGSFDDNQAENIKPLKEVEPGRSYTPDELTTFMVQYSDNNAMDLLLKFIGPDAVSAVYADMDIAQPTSTDDDMSPKIFSPFFRVLYSATYLGSQMSEQALELLSYSDFPQGIPAGVPADVTVAGKFGERNFIDQTQGPSKELHDCGIVYQPEHPYLLCIMTKGSDFIKLEGVIRDISALVWGSFK
jgi:beta-lactamase class A